MKVLFFGGGKMGDLARSAISQIEGVEMVSVAEGAVTPIRGEGYDLIFSASHPARIPQSIVELTALGAVNLHTALLPEGRGWHPLNWALIWGKHKTGITIHKIVDSFDAGDIVMQHELPIFDTDTIASLRSRVDDSVPMLIGHFFSDVKRFMSQATPQNQADVSYAPKRIPEDSELNLAAPDRDIYNLWRSCDPSQYPAYVWRYGIKYRVINGRMDGGIFCYDLEI